MDKSRETKGKKYGKANILASFRRTLIVITNADGEAVAWGASATDDIYETARIVAVKAIDTGIHSVGVTVKGPGKGRERAIQGLQDAGLEILLICDKTPIPHNGVRQQRTNTR